MAKHLLSLTLFLLIALTAVGAAVAQPASPQAPPTVEDHLAWVLSLFDGGAADLTEADVRARFDENFQRLVPPKEFIATVRQLADTLGPLELVEHRSTGETEFVGIFKAASGDYVMISFAVDPGTGRMTGFFITPATAPGPAATPAAGPATPQATPVPASPVAVDADAQIARYREQAGAIQAVGEPVVAAVLAGDDNALAPYLSPVVATALGEMPIGDVIASYTERQVEMAFAEAGAIFFGQWNGDEIAGVMVQNGAPYGFSITAETTQNGDLPEGRFTGSIPQARLNIAVTFAAGTSGGLTAALDIPAQGVEGVALSNVTYSKAKPVGDRVDMRVFAPGGQRNSYTADYAWGDNLLRVVVGVDVETGKVTSLQAYPAVPLPPDTAAAESQATYRLPFDGTWWVFWGGQTELRNYHAAVSSQRYAYDFVIWKDGATWHGQGTSNDDYWAWGQPVLAPTDGVVVDAVRTAEDLPPNAPLATRAQVRNPGGNYVVIQTGEDEYVIVAHMQANSVRVRAGDEVHSGDVLGLVGNSGNSSEPHIHIHVQATPNLLDVGAQGIPLRFDAVVDGQRQRGVFPEQGSFVAPG